MFQGGILQNKLVELQGKIETIKEVERARGENFNLFSILGVERLEVQTHSAFIFELLDPSGSHDQGDVYLRLFIKNVLNEKKFEYENVIVKREDNYPGEGRIDFTIENHHMFIAIEMKIDAIDQKNQIGRYIKIAERKNRNSKVYYLTLDGRDSNEDSKNVDKKGSDSKKKYKNLSFSSDILRWIELCIGKSAKLPVLRETLVQYEKLIKKLTNKTSEEISMEVVSIIDNPKIAEAATVMSRNIGLAWAIREAKFWIDLITKTENHFKKSDWELILDEEYFNIFYDENDQIKNIETIASGIEEYRKNKNNDIEIQFCKEIENCELTLRLYQYNSQDDLMFQLDRFKCISDKKFEELTKELGLNSKNKTDRYGTSGLGINFYGYRWNAGEPTYDLFDDERLDEMVEKTKRNIVEKLNVIDKYLKKAKGMS
jgi:hypothetical protein